MTSYLFPSGRFSLERLKALSERIGKDKLVVDLSCRRQQAGWVVAMNKWQDLTDLRVDAGWTFVAFEETERTDGLLRLP